MKRLVGIVSSLRTSAVLMLLLSALLVVNVAVPQKAVVGGMAGMAPPPRWIEALGLTSVVTSRIFVIVLVLFFVNLAAVLARRLRPTFARLSKEAPSEEAIEKWTAGARAISAPKPAQWSPATVIGMMRGWGYAPRRVGERTWWGVKHRWAPLGFVMFHASFFLLLAGGILIYMTRFAGVVRLVEGQTFDGSYAGIVRRPPDGRMPDVSFHLARVDTRLEGNDPVELSAEVARESGARNETTRVNAPVSWGDTSIIVTEAGLAPVLWVQDPDGYTIDRVTASASLRKTTELAVGDGGLIVTIQPKFSRAEFPSRDGLAKAPFELAVRMRGREVARGVLHRGETLLFEGGSVRLEDVRYWAGFLVVSERGGWILILGFAIGVSGITWRLLLHRRELVLRWDDESVRLAGRADFFPERFQDEMNRILEMMVARVSSEPPRDEAGAA
jgi:hypothetical protein